MLTQFILKTIQPWHLLVLQLLMLLEILNCLALEELLALFQVLRLRFRVI